MRLAAVALVVGLVLGFVCSPVYPLRCAGATSRSSVGWSCAWGPR